MFALIKHCSNAAKKSGPKVFGSVVKDREGQIGDDCFKVLVVKMVLQATKFHTDSSVWLSFTTLMVWANIYLPGVVFR